MLYNFLNNFFLTFYEGVAITSDLSTKWCCKQSYSVARSHFIIPKYHFYKYYFRSLSEVKRETTDFKWQILILNGKIIFYDMVKLFWLRQKCFAQVRSLDKNLFYLLTIYVSEIQRRINRIKVVLGFALYIQKLILFCQITSDKIQFFYFWTPTLLNQIHHRYILIHPNHYYILNQFCKRRLDI